MKTKLFTIALLLMGATALTLVSCDGNKHDDKNHTDSVVVVPADGSHNDTTTVNVHVDTTGHVH